VIAVFMLPREAWEKKLRAKHNKPLEGRGPLNTAEWWITPWKHVFTVPIETEDERCDMWAIERLIADLERSRPDPHGG
jgi:hypothetical protein